MRNVAKLIAFLPFAALPVAAEADGDSTPDHPMSVNVAVDTRFDFDLKNPENAHHTSGFYGRFLNLHINGRINDELTFAFRQRLNKFGETRNDVFGATDWIYLSYSPTPQWTLSGGKQVVGIGGYEYDRNPINVYFASMFWNNIACYQFGASATYHFDGGRNNLMAQICNSPYQPVGSNCLAYNLMWTGGFGCWHTLWSANLIEWQEERFGNIISLGNRFDLGNAYAEVDVMNRYTGHQHFLFDDYSVIVKGCASFGKCDVFAKGGYEHFRLVPGQGDTVDKPFYGAGVEYYPFSGSRDLRLHVVADLTHDAATGAAVTEFAAGFTWRVNVFNKQAR